LFGVGAADAAPVLDFDMTTPTPGSLSYSGAAAPLIGNAIEVDGVVGKGTPDHNLLRSTCVACVLNLQTGNFVSYDAAQKIWSFGPGGAITITGGVDFTDNSSIADIAPGSTLLQGAFDAAQVIAVSTGIFDFRIAAGAFDDVKHPTLLSFYGLPNVPYVGGFNLSFSGTGVAGGAFHSTELHSGDIVNAPAVPLPAAIWLLGSALIGMLPAVRARHARKSVASMLA
jgi:hypothetical protein